MNVEDSSNKILVVRNLEQSQQYRCVVSNEAGNTRSDVATVTVLSEFAVNMTLSDAFNIIFKQKSLLIHKAN